MPALRAKAWSTPDGGELPSGEQCNLSIQAVAYGRSYQGLLPGPVQARPRTLGRACLSTPTWRYTTSTVLLGQVGTLLALGLVGVALATGQAGVFVVALGLLLADRVAQLWERWSLSGVEYRRQLNQRRVFFGEEVEVAVEITNRKPLPLAWLRAEDEWPESLPLVPSPIAGRVVPCYKARRVTLRNLVALGWYEQVRRRYRLRCLARGEFAFGPARLQAGDLFGLRQREREVEAVDRLLVYPRVVPLARLGLEALQPLGNLRARHRLLQDPAWLLGLRDYQPGDDPRQIDWKASARAQALQVRIHETTTSHQLHVLLNLNTYAGFWWWQGYDRDLLETSIMAAAAVVAWGLEQGFAVGLAANGNARRADRQVLLPAARDPAHLTRALEALARVLPFATMPFERLLDQTVRLPRGATAVVITSVATPEVLGATHRLARGGRTVALVLVGSRHPAVRLPGVTVHHLRDESRWAEVGEVAVSPL